ncbi:MAG: hypothetical protein IKE33_00135 [Erysipelotrichaceae bacterium]|nr:hypothetical protein [Erysipelotrichaceae bacterium]
MNVIQEVAEKLSFRECQQYDYLKYYTFVADDLESAMIKMRYSRCSGM